MFNSMDSYCDDGYSSFIDSLDFLGEGVMVETKSAEITQVPEAVTEIGVNHQTSLCSQGLQPNDTNSWQVPAERSFLSVLAETCRKDQVQSITELIEHQEHSKPSQVIAQQETTAGFFQSFHPEESLQVNQYQDQQLPLNYQTSALQLPMPGAHIKILHTTSGITKTVVKRKRRRTSFTTEQIAILEDIFHRKPYVTREDREKLTETLQINDKAIKVWFQNRRMKEKKDLQSDDSSEGTYFDSNQSRLDFIEAQINERTDELGFVTLDDQAMEELVNAIDYVVSRNIELDSVLVSQDLKVKEEQTIFEPISPPNFNFEDFIGSQEPTRFEPLQPEEPLRRLFDIHNFLRM